MINISKCLVRSTTTLLNRIKPKNAFSSLLSLVILSFIITSCKGEEDTPKDTLNGTEWTCSSSDEIEHLEFISDSEVEYFYTKDGAVNSRVARGTYHKSGNQVLFHNLKLAHNLTLTTFKSASITGKTMVIKYLYGSSDYVWESTFRQVK